jgi:hypothetical protein
MGCLSFGLSLAFPFCLPCDDFGHQSFIGFFCPLLKNRNPSSNNTQPTTYESSTIMKFKGMKNYNSTLLYIFETSNRQK